MSLLGLAGLSAFGNIAGQYMANQANSKEAERNRKWQERMANTAHQREMADLEKAGINPLLMTKFGGGATPSGAVAKHDSVTSQAINSALTVRQQNMDIKVKQEQAKNLQADTDKKRVEADTLQTRVGYEGTRVGIEQKRLELDKDYILKKIGLTQSQIGLNNQQVKNIASNMRVNEAKINQMTFQNSFTQAKTERERGQIIMDTFRKNGIIIDNNNKSFQNKLIQANILGKNISNEQMELIMQSIKQRGKAGQHTEWVVNLFGKVLGAVAKFK